RVSLISSFCPAIKRKKSFVLDLGLNQRFDKLIRLIDSKVIWHFLEVLVLRCHIRSQIVESHRVTICVYMNTSETHSAFFKRRSETPAGFIVQRVWKMQYFIPGAELAKSHSPL